MLKSLLEIARIRRSVGAAVAGYRAGLQAAAAGMTEKELVAIISSTMYRSGTTAGTKPLFVNCVSGRARYPLVDSRPRTTCSATATSCSSTAAAPATATSPTSCG